MDRRFVSSFVAVFTKEFVHIRRDRATLVIALAIPVFQLVLFGFIDQTVSNLPTVVVDQDDTHAARDDITAGRARVGVILPPDFHDKRAKGEEAKMLVLIDGSDANVSAQALAAVNGVAADENLQAVTEKVQVGVNATGNVLSVQPIILFNPDGRTANYIIPGLIAIL